MSSDVRFEQMLADALVSAAPEREPDRLIDDILAATRDVRRRPGWLARMRERPMRRQAQVLVGSPTLRLAYLLAITLLAAVLVVGSATVGASILNPAPAVNFPPPVTNPPTPGPTPVPATPVPPDRGVFTPAGTLEFERGYHAATLESAGSVLVMGGSDAVEALSSVERWDPSTGSFSALESGLRRAGAQTATLLNDGTVLVTHIDSSAELWDPIGDTFALTGSLASSRGSATATLLRDGRVLVVGGQADAHSLVSAEIYDPRSESFRPTGSLATARYEHTATLLPDGRVLIIGGYDWQPARETLVGSAEMWDPATETFSSAGTLAVARYGHTATLLPDGRVIVVGGHGPTGPVAAAELWDPATQSFEPTGLLNEARGSHSATLLDDGRVLVVGGDVPARNQFTCPLVCVSSAEIWDPSDGSFTPTGSMAEARANHTATLLPDGRVLVIGGGEMDAVLGSAEVYELKAAFP